MDTFFYTPEGGFTKLAEIKFLEVTFGAFYPDIALESYHIAF